MDTDDLTELAWSIIVHAAEVSDTLRVELGVMAGEFATEDDWLQGIRTYLAEVAAGAADYVEEWSLEQFERVSPAMLARGATELSLRVDDVLATPLDQRGAPPW